MVVGAVTPATECNKPLTDIAGVIRVVDWNPTLLSTRILYRLLNKDNPEGLQGQPGFLFSIPISRCGLLIDAPYPVPLTLIPEHSDDGLNSLSGRFVPEPLIPGAGQDVIIRNLLAGLSRSTLVSVLLLNRHRPANRIPIGLSRKQERIPDAIARYRLVNLGYKCAHPYRRYLARHRQSVRDLPNLLQFDPPFLRLGGFEESIYRSTAARDKSGG